MKTTLLTFILLTSAVSSMAAQSATPSVELTGTWSGNWTPKGGALDSVTIELRQESAGNLNGKFVTPVPMTFTKASFTPRTATVMLEALDEKSGKRYKIDGKVTGTELKGTLVVGDQTGELQLTKWTYVPRSY